LGSARDVWPVSCVGERMEERGSTRTERVLKRQLESGFDRLRAEEAHRITIAYEPVWAIGTGETATAEQAGAAHRLIRRWVAQRLTQGAAAKVRLLYGGRGEAGHAHGVKGVPRRA